MAIYSLLKKETLDNNIRYFCYFLIIYPLIHISIRFLIPEWPLSLTTDISPEVSRLTYWLIGLLALSIDVAASIIILKGYLKLGLIVLLVNAILSVVRLFIDPSNPGLGLIIAPSLIVIYIIFLWKFIIIKFLLFYNEQKNSGSTGNWQKYTFYLFRYFILWPIFVSVLWVFLSRLLAYGHF